MATRTGNKLLSLMLLKIIATILTRLLVSKNLALLLVTLPGTLILPLKLLSQRMLKKILTPLTRTTKMLRPLELRLVEERPPSKPSENERTKFQVIFKKIKNTLRDK